MLFQLTLGVVFLLVVFIPCFIHFWRKTREFKRLRAQENLYEEIMTAGDDKAAKLKELRAQIRKLQGRNGALDADEVQNPEYHYQMVPLTHGYQRLKTLARYFDEPLTRFQDWTAILMTNLGTYRWHGVNYVERDMKPGAETIKIRFTPVYIVSPVTLERMLVLNERGECIGASQNGLSMQADDYFTPEYTINT